MPKIWASGIQEGRELRWEVVRSAIDDRDYETALDEIKLLFQDRPEDFEQLERQLNLIQGDYRNFSQILSQLITNLQEHPEDVEGTIALADQLINYGITIDAELLRKIKDTQTLAQIARDRNRLLEIVRAAIELRNMDKYGEALMVYRGGFSLQREKFVEVYRDDERRAVLDGYVEMLNTIIDTIVTQYSDTASNLAQYDRQLRASDDFNAQVFETAAQSIYTDYVFASRELGQADQHAASISELREDFVESSEQDDNWFVIFIDLLTSGEGEGEGGIVGTIDDFRVDIRNRILEGITFYISPLHEEAQTAYAEMDFTRAQRVYDKLQSLVRQASPFLSEFAALDADIVEVRIPNERIESLAETNAQFSEFVAGLRYDFDFYSDFYLYYDSIDTGIDIVRNMITVREPFTAHEEWLNLEREPLDHTPRVGALNRYLSNIDAIEESWEEGKQLYGQQFPSASSGREQWLDTVDLLITEARTFGIENKGAALAYFRDSYVPRYEGLIADVDGTILQAQMNIDGIDEEGISDNLVYRYPDQGALILTRQLDQLQTAYGTTTSLIGELESLSSSDDPDGIDTETALIAVRSQLLEKIDIVEQELERANEQIAASQSFRDEGAQLLANSRTQLQVSNIAEAKSNWEQAREVIFQALELQDDPRYRQESDAEILVLGEEIRIAENRIIVQQVRALIGESQQAFDSEEYIEAGDILDEAETLWNRTNIAPNSEIERLRQFIDIAILFGQERDLGASDPLYAVVSNYLTIAGEEYENASRLTARQQQAERERHIGQALKNVEQVIAIFPYNWEARILELQLAQLSNAEDFNVIFRRRYNEAIDQRDINPQEALISLQTLETLDPNYPNLQNAIRDLEIVLGLRVLPADNTGIQESAQLLAQAQNLVQGGSDAQIIAAIQLLEQSLAANSQNNESQLLLDTLRINRGGQISAALSSADEQLFRRAQTLFVQERHAQSFAVVERLWRTAQNQLYPPLRSLRGNLQIQLGI